MTKTERRFLHPCDSTRNAQQASPHRQRRQRQQSLRSVRSVIAAVAAHLLASTGYAATPTPVPQLRCLGSTIPDCPTPSTSQTDTITSCAALNAYVFNTNNQRVNLAFEGPAGDECALTHALEINANNVFIRGTTGRITLFPNFTPPAGSAGIRINGNNVRIERVRVAGGFPVGIRVEAGRTDAVLSNLTVANNDFGAKLAGVNVCMHNVTAEKNVSVRLTTPFRQ